MLDNPVLNRISRAADRAGFAYEESLAAVKDAPRSRAVALDDVVVKTGALFALLLVGAAVGWQIPALTLPAMLVGLVLGLVGTFARSVLVPVILAYALAEGVFLGGISMLFAADAQTSLIVQQAVIGTLTAFGVMLFVYKQRWVAVNGAFRRFMTVALMSYLLIGVASFVSAVFFDVSGGWGFYGMGPLGIGLCMLGVALAAFALLIDFEQITSAIEQGLPERESWRLAFGLTVTLVWLYIEILRLIALSRK